MEFVFIILVIAAISFFIWLGVKGNKDKKIDKGTKGKRIA